ncbi:MAG TPA: hypothetical protein VGP93_16430, partial [Polyangiaceae bacterium]|nr:hypothetical protein [Polyangiaceae bacterium]
AMADAIEAAAAQGERIASAREVAALVDELAGEELHERGERVAAWFAGQKREHTERVKASSPADASARTELAPRSQPPSGHSQSPPGWSRPPSSGSQPARRWSLTAKTALAAVVLIAAAFAATFVTLRERQAGVAAARPSLATPVRSLAKLEPPAAMPVPAPRVDPPAPDATPSAAPAKRDQHQTTSELVPEPQPTTVQKLPNRIVTKNPYRDAH